VRGLWRGEKRGKGRKRQYFNGLRWVGCHCTSEAKRETGISNGYCSPHQSMVKSYPTEIEGY